MKKIVLAFALAVPVAAQAAPDLSGFSGQIDGGFIYARVRQDATISRLLGTGPGIENLPITRAVST